MRSDGSAGSASRSCPVTAAREAAVPLYGQSDTPVPHLLDQLRQRFGTLAPVEVAPGVLAWIALSYDLNREVLQDARTFPRDPRRWKEAKEGRATPDKVPGPFWYFRNALASDEPDHSRYREVIVSALDTIASDRARVTVDMIAHDLMVPSAKEGRADLVADLAFKLPLLLLNRYFGLDDTHGRQLVDLMRQVWDGGPEAEAAMGGLFSYAQTVTLERRADPGQDIVSRMIAHPNGLDDEEVAHQLILMISAAHDPLMNLIANTFHELLTRNSSRVAVMSGNSRIEEVVDAVLWKAPPIMLMPGRYPAMDMELGGWQISEGDCVIIGYGAAHTDPHILAHMDSASSLASRAHLSFGTGPHQCPARNLARQIAVDTVTTVFRLLPDMALSVPADRLRRRTSPFAHGLEELPITFTPVQAAPRDTPPSGEQKCPHTPSPSPSPQETTGAWRGIFVMPDRWRESWSRIWRSGR